MGFGDPAATSAPWPVSLSDQSDMAELGLGQRRESGSKPSSDKAFVSGAWEQAVRGQGYTYENIADEKYDECSDPRKGEVEECAKCRQQDDRRPEEEGDGEIILAKDLKVLEHLITASDRLIDVLNACRWLRCRELR